VAEDEEARPASRVKKPFNNPFRKVRIAPPEKAAPAPKAPPAPPPPRREGLTDDDLWTLATEGAEPLTDRSARIKPDPQPLAMVPVQLDPEIEAYEELRALVRGAAPFDLADSDEFIEGSAHGLDPRVVRRLRRGDFAVQSHLDLHGKRRDEARAELEAFLARARQSGKRCVLVVHGRGLHSKDQVPVLKDALKRWMTTARFADHVLAFATARPHDGGAGAVYVLLRRQ
jgi:DNA-nicking Smr family endonuclease